MRLVRWRWRGGFCRCRACWLVSAPVGGHGQAGPVVVLEGFVGGESRGLEQSQSFGFVPGVEFGDGAPRFVLDGDSGGADGHVHPPAVHVRPDLVAVAVDVSVPVLVGLAGLPPDRVEPARGQRAQRLHVVGEHHVDRIRRAVADRPAQPVAFRGHQACEPFAGLGLHGRDHEVAAKEPDRVLHAALPAAGIRVAETHVQPAMADERLEHAGQGRLAPGVPAAGAGSVVDRQRARHPADVPEDRRET